MKLYDLVGGLVNDEVLKTFHDVQISTITDTSARFLQGSLFVAISGHHSDGHLYIHEAIKNGASAIAGEEEGVDLPVPYIKVDNSRKFLGLVSKRLYHDPSKNKVMIGITGTNGKTTTSFLLKHILEQNGLSCSLIGTIKNIINGEEITAVNTTPNALSLNELLSQSKDEVVIMEVSSHGLSQFRLEGIEFDYCLFTNLAPEHLEYHGSITEYFNVKSLLFKKLKPGGKAIINLDNEWGIKLSRLLRSKSIPVYSIGHSPSSNIKIRKFLSNNTGVTVSESVEKQIDIQIALPGVHNLYNAIMALAAARQLQIQDEEIVSALRSFKGVPGRFESFTNMNGVTIVIDYAHTADALFHCLKTARDCGAERIVHVFGFRGNRDARKREGMLKISAELSDQYILTVDDLNNVPLEEMLEVLHQLNRYETGNENRTIIADRTEAISHAINRCKKGDWVLITGKGHEVYQQNYVLPTSSDMETVQYLNS